MQTHTPELENIIYLQRTHKVKNNVPELTLGDEKPPRISLSLFYAGHLSLSVGPALTSVLFPQWDSLRES